MTHGVERVCWNGIAFNDVWRIDLEAITGKVVGKELSGMC
jgi:hypothetical protein